MSICEAIAGKHLLEFTYDGHRRLVEPHCHGNSLKGKDVFRAYQIEGGSSRGESVGWKMFETAKAEPLSVLTDTFAGPRRGYNPADSQMSVVHCGV